MPNFASRSAVILGWGSLAFAAWALANPEHFARFAGMDRQKALNAGLRDLGIGFALLTAGDRKSLLSRAAADGWDALTVKKPNVASGAALFSAWALLAAVAARG